MIFQIIRAQRRVSWRLMACFALAAAATLLLFSRLDLDPAFGGIMTGVVEVTCEMKADSDGRLLELLPWSRVSAQGLPCWLQNHTRACV